MNRKDLLEILCLLSALESWAYAQNTTFPKYLNDDLKKLMKQMHEEILKGIK